MNAKLEPVEACAEHFTQGTFAIIERADMAALARAMPDCQSAVLFALSWQAAFQAKMRHGPLAGQRVARISAEKLASIIGKPVRTVRHAISKLKARGKIESEDVGAGRTAIHRLTLGPQQQGEHEDVHHRHPSVPDEGDEEGQDVQS